MANILCNCASFNTPRFIEDIEGFHVCMFIKCVCVSHLLYVMSFKTIKKCVFLTGFLQIMIWSMRQVRSGFSSVAAIGVIQKNCGEAVG